MLKEVFLLTLLLPICSSSFTQSSATKEETLEWIAGKITSSKVDHESSQILWPTDYGVGYKIDVPNCVIDFELKGEYLKEGKIIRLYFNRITTMTLTQGTDWHKPYYGILLSSSVGTIVEDYDNTRHVSGSIELRFDEKGMNERVKKAIEHLCSLCGCRLVGDKF